MGRDHTAERCSDRSWSTLGTQTRSLRNTKDIYQAGNENEMRGSERSLCGPVEGGSQQVAVVILSRDHAGFEHGSSLRATLSPHRSSFLLQHLPQLSTLKILVRAGAVA